MAGTDGNFSSVSTSSSVSGNPEVSNYAFQLMQQMYQWGQQQFAQNSQLTDQVVGSLMGLYSQLSGIGTDLMNQYQKMFEPEYQNLVNDANNYASQARIQQAMGAAESGVAQSFNGQRNASLADLQAFGIDPSSGRYAQLDEAERTQQAAAQAGAGFQAEQATEATGRALRSEALQLGSVMPSQATAAYNAAGQAATAAENAKLANAQEGVNLLQSGVPYGNIAQQYKTSTANAHSGNLPGGGGGGRGSGGGGNAPNTGYVPPYGTQGNSSGVDGSGANGNGPTFPNTGMPGGTVAVDDTPTGGPIDVSGGTPYDPGGTDNWGSSGENLNGPVLPPSNDPSGYIGGGGDGGGGSGDYAGGGAIHRGYSTHSGMGSGRKAGMGSGAEDYEGAIPSSKSPSGGRVTDDIPGKVNDTGEPIRVNAGEFIMPKHAVQWYGHKFFQDLIDKSKKGRANAPGKPILRPAIPMSGERHG